MASSQARAQSRAQGRPAAGSGFERTLAIVQADIKDADNALGHLVRSQSELEEHAASLDDEKEAEEFLQVISENNDALAIKRARLAALREEEAALVGDGVKGDEDGGGAGGGSGGGRVHDSQSEQEVGLHL